MLGYYLLPLFILLLLGVPRRHAAIVFLSGAIFIPMGISFALGNVNLFPARILVMTGLLRSVVRLEMRYWSPTRTDLYMLVFGLIYLVSSFGHNDVGSTFVNHAAKVLDTVGLYALFRCWIRDWDEALRLMRLMLIFTIPLAFFMAIEFLTHRNLFSYIGGISMESQLRNGSIRARGPFRHEILAGTFGAVALPFTIALWRSYPLIARIALGCSLVIVVVSTSSGPIMTSGAVVFALVLWRYRTHLKAVIRSCLAGLLILHFFVMKVPVWYLMAKFDLGGSGWHRARLIDRAIEFLNEWWLCGTDYTRHWMPTGTSWSPDASDITNQYIAYGVVGGLPLMLAFIAILASCFKRLSNSLKCLPEFQIDLKFAIWCFGCALFGHAITMLSVSYYDQSEAIFYCFVAVITSGLCWVPVVEWDEESLPELADVENIDHGSTAVETQVSLSPAD
jgi:hypothetical protein